MDFLRVLKRIMSRISSSVLYCVAITHQTIPLCQTHPKKVDKSSSFLRAASLARSIVQRFSLVLVVEKITHVTYVKNPTIICNEKIHGNL